MGILPAKIPRNSSSQESRVSPSGGLLPCYVHEAGSRPVYMHNTIKSGLLTVHSSHSSLGQRLSLKPACPERSTTDEGHIHAGGLVALLPLLSLFFSEHLRIFKKIRLIPSLLLLLKTGNQGEKSKVVFHFPASSSWVLRGHHTVSHVCVQPLTHHPNIPAG